MVADYLAAGSLIAARITAQVASIKRVDALGQLYSLLEEEPQAMAQHISGKLPAAFVGFDGEAIREGYDLETELKYARIGVGAAMGMYAPTTDEIQELTVYGEFVEGVRQWGRTERAKLGL